MNKGICSFPDFRDWFIDPEMDRWVQDWERFVDNINKITGIFVTRSSEPSMLGRFILIEGINDGVFGANQYLIPGKWRFVNGPWVLRDKRRYCRRASVVLRNEKQSFLKINDMIYFNNNCIVELLDPISSSDSQSDTSSSDSDSNE